MKKLLLFALMISFYIVPIITTSEPYVVQAATQTTVYSPAEVAQQLDSAYSNGELSVSFTAYMDATSSDQVIKAFSLDNIGLELLKLGTFTSGAIDTYEISYTRPVLRDNRYEYQFTIKLQPFMTTAQQASVKQYVQAQAALIAQQASSDLDKVMLVNELITRSFSYSFDTATTPHAPYALISEGKGVCQAYALLAYELLHTLNLEVYYMTGNAEGVAHAWNLVKIDGQWYNLDTTYNDPLFNDPTINRAFQTSYAHLLLSDAVIRSTHTRNFTHFPAATSTKYDALYSSISGSYTAEAIYISDSERNLKIRKFNKATMQEMPLTNLSGWNLAADTKSLYFIEYTTSSNLKKWDAASNNVTIIDQNVEVAYREGNTLLYKKHNATSWQRIELAVSYSNTDKQNAAEIDTRLLSLNDMSRSFVADFTTIKAAYTALPTQAQVLVTQKNLLDRYEQLANQFGKQAPSELFWGDLTTTDTQKTWTIRLNEALENTSANKGAIQVVDSFGRSVNTVITIDDRSIRISPTAPYAKAHKYHIVMTSGLTGTSGSKLRTGFWMTFVVE